LSSSKHKINFGVRIPVSGPFASVENIKKVSKEAESLGFDTLWVHDLLIWNSEQSAHHVSSGSVEAVVPGSDPNFFESITTLSYLAAITSKVKLGVAVVVLPLRNPIVLAKQVMNLDAFSNGRLILGVGSGAPLVGKTFESAGVSFEKRGEITDDYLKALVAIFEQNKSSYSGKYSRFSEIEMFPKPLQKPHPPLVVGGLGRAPRRAALYGDGWIPASLTPDQIRSGIEKIKSIALKNGRKIGDDFLVGHEIFASLAKDSESARRNAAATIGTYARSIGRGGDEVTLLGSPSEVSKKVENYIEAGVNMFEMKFIYRDLERLSSQLKLFASEVLPSFR
jgi:probable F420-dependent oxidoreductase